MRILFSLLLILLISHSTFAQKLEAENVYEITGKANRGYLGDVTIDEPNNDIALTFVTKSNDKMAKFETYHFDGTTYAFKKLDTDEEEFEKAKTKFKWFKYKGENYSVEAVTVERNLTGTLVLKRKLISYTWSWFWGGYDRDVKVLEKVKPKNDEGNKYYAWTAAENNQTGEVLVLVGPKAKIGAKDQDPNAYMKNFSILTINSDLDVTKESKIDFQYPMMPMISNPIYDPDATSEDDADLSNSDWGLVFVPVGGPGMNKVADPDFSDFTLVRVNGSNDLKQRTSFKPEYNLWGIQDMISSGNEVYLIGPAKKDDKYLNQIFPANMDDDARTAAIEAMKWQAFQIMKLTDTKVDYLKATSIDEFDAKLKTPPSQKKAPSYDGKKFAVVNFIRAANGDVLVMGQNFNQPKDGPRKYTDPVMFHFGSDGALKAQYGIRRDENNKYAEMAPSQQDVFWKAGSSTAYWMITEIKGVKSETELKNAKLKVLAYPSVAKIDIASGDVGDFVAFGQDQYYLHNEHPYLPTSNKSKIVFFGESKGGKTLWFGRMPME
ncbi:MAG: hypothetical protein JST18_06495 [Bacteroidetes bacterium]|nr:hypothetical protein [Bacteroidota bacterium]